jgi:hypothetical protein
MNPLMFEKKTSRRRTFENLENRDVDSQFGLEFDLAAMALQFAFHHYNELASFRWGAVSDYFYIRTL